MAVQVQPLIRRPDEDNGFFKKALPLIGAGAGALVGGLASGGAAAPAGGAAGAALFSGAGAATGAGLGMGLGSAAQGYLQGPQGQSSQSPTIQGSDNAFSRRLDSLKQGTDNTLSQLKSAALALPNLPPELRQEAAHPIISALVKDAYGQGRA